MKLTTKQIIAIIATLGMITVNALANILPFNGITTAEVSNRLNNYFVPAGYVFIIWGIIYLALLVFSFGYTFVVEKKRNYLDEILPLYIFSCVLNSFWIICWHYGFFLTTVVLMVTLLITLAMIYLILKKNLPVTKKEALVIHAPFSIYLSWISVATIANISGVLWLLNWNAFGLPGNLWAAIMMVVAGVLAVITALQRKDIAFSLVIVWAIIGIMVKFPEQKIMLYSGILSVAMITASWIFVTTKTYLSNHVTISKK